jgi:translin
MSDLDSISDAIRTAFVAKNAARDAAISRSRELIRHCAESIRATHRREWENAQVKLATAQAAADELRAVVQNYADLYYSGYMQDALKEVVEAFATYAIIRGEDLPTPESLNVDHAAYLNGLAEAATELRRFILDLLRREDADVTEAERLLNWMDSIYDQLVTFDFPDAITGDLRRRTDVVRGVLERTRGDLTTTIQQHRLQAALKRFEGRVVGE